MSRGYDSRHAVSGRSNRYKHRFDRDLRGCLRV